MPRECDGSILSCLVEGGGDEERLGQLVAEVRRQMQVLEAGASLDREPAAGAHERIALQMRVLAGQELDHVHAESLGAAVEECEREVVLATLHRRVLRNGDAGGLGHFLHCQVHVLAKRANPAGDLGYPWFHQGSPSGIGHIEPGHAGRPGHYNER